MEKWSREVKLITQDHRASKWWRTIQTQDFLIPKPLLLSLALFDLARHRGGFGVLGRQGHRQRHRGALSLPKEEALYRWSSRNPQLPGLRAEGSLVVSDLGKTLFPEDYPGSGVRGRLARERIKWGGHFCSSSCLVHGANRGSGAEVLGAGRAGGTGWVWRVRAREWSPMWGQRWKLGHWASWAWEQELDFRQFTFEVVMRWLRRYFRRGQWP